MSMEELTDRTTLVVGASRGLGRGIATAIAEAGSTVIGGARSEAPLAALAGSFGNFTAEVADAADPAVASDLLDRYRPDVVVLVAGSTPVIRPLPEQTWETFSANWQTDVRIAFHWTSASLLRPLEPGSKV